MTIDEATRTTVLMMAANGLGVDEIATALNISDDEIRELLARSATTRDDEPESPAAA